MFPTCKYCGISVTHPVLWGAHLCGKKHQRVAAKFGYNNEANSRSIHVTGYGDNVAEKDIFVYFASFGQVANIIFNHAPPKQRFCFIEYEEVKVMERVLAEKHSIENRSIKVTKKTAKQENAATTAATTPPNAQGMDKKTATQLLLHKLVPLNSLQDQIEALAEEMVLNPKEIQERKNVALIIKNCFAPRFANCIVEVFGSSANGLGFHSCDLDVFVDLGLDSWSSVQPKRTNSTAAPSQEERVKLALNLIKGAPGIMHVVSILRTRVPLLRFRYKPFSVCCDVSFRNPLSVRNTQLIHYYTLVDPRVRLIMLVIRFWASRQDLSGADSSTKISNYALTMLIIFAMQHIDPPLILTIEELRQLHLVQGKPKEMIDGWDCTFCKDVELVVATTRNRMSLKELLEYIFRIFAKFDFRNNVICPLTGKPLSKAELAYPDSLPESMKCYRDNLIGGFCERFRTEGPMCVQDPFELSHNLTRLTDLRGVEIFQKKCLQAHRFCAICPETELLAKLFTPSRELLDDDFGAKRKRKKVERLPNSVKLSIPLLFNGEEDVTVGILKKIMEEGLKFEISQQNGTTLHCKAFWPTWTSRKKTAKEFKFPHEMAKLEKECHVSSFIVDIICKKSRPQEPVADFLCEVTTVEGRAEITMRDVSSQGRLFCDVSTFLQKFIPSMIEKGLKECNGQ